MDNPGDSREVQDEKFIRIVQLNTLLIQHYYMKYVHKTPCMTSSQTGYKWLMEVLDGNDRRFYNAFRMQKHVFHRLCADLEVLNGGLLGSDRLNHIEVVGMIVYLLGQGCGIRTVAERFQHSPETVCRNIGIALDNLCVLGHQIIRPEDPDFNGVAPEIMRDSRYMPHFKDCIGAIDGVHIPASIAPEKQIPYIGRKGIPTQNIMAACNFDMQFIFVCAGWEGAAHDTRVFLSAIRDPDLNFPHPPPGKYYVVDSGYPTMNGFLGPYKGAKQHFQEYRRREPRNENEVFNQAHSSLRGVIERTFGVWKKKWHVLRNMQGYSFKKQIQIVIATMTLHNYIRRHGHRDIHFVQGEGSAGEGSNGEIEMEDDQEEGYHGHGAQEMETLRNIIAQSLMSVRNN